MVWLLTKTTDVVISIVKKTSTINLVFEYLWLIPNLRRPIWEALKRYTINGENILYAVSNICLTLFFKDPKLWI